MKILRRQKKRQRRLQKRYLPVSNLEKFIQYPYWKKRLKVALANKSLYANGNWTVEFVGNASWNYLPRKCIVCEKSQNEVECFTVKILRYASSLYCCKYTCPKCGHENGYTLSNPIFFVRWKGGKPKKIILIDENLKTRILTS